MKPMLLALLLLPSLASAELVMVDDATPPPGTPTAIVQIQPVPTPKEVWKGATGSSLKSTITEWADKAQWNVVWDSKTDYPLLAPVVFEGRFDEAVSQFIRLYVAAEQPIWVDIQPQQRVVYVTNRKQ